MTRTVDVIIVNWNAGDLLQETVEALAGSDAASFRFGRVVVVDNASTDGSADFLIDYRDAPPTTDYRLPTVDTGDSAFRPLLVRNDTNRGFAAACNQGAAGSGADYLLFLNPDTRVEPDTLDVSVRAMERSPETGILGVQLVDASGDPQPSCARFPTSTRYMWKALGLDRLLPSFFEPHYLMQFDHRHSRVVDQVMGAYFFVRRGLFERLQGFDERFFVYFEEVDFALRAREQGWTTLFCADARAYHLGGGTTDQVRAHRLFYSLQSRLRFALKHFRSVGAMTVLFSCLLIELPARLIHTAVRGDYRDAKSTLAAYQLLLHALPTTFGTQSTSHSDEVDK